MASALTSTTSLKASKTWVLPPRPKPGRKSKKDLAAAAAAAKADERDRDKIKYRDDDDRDESEEAEKAINRTKQKASRERKQEYIAELEAKVRSYEQGDGERASFFQGLAKTYSEQNAALTRENEELKKKLALYESGIQPVSLSSISPMARSPPSGSATMNQSQPILTRKASSDLAVATRSKRQRTKSISSNASSSSNHHHHHHPGTSTTSVSTTTTTSLASALSSNASSSTNATSVTAVPAHYSRHHSASASRSPAAMIIPSPGGGGGGGMAMHASPSPAASSSSYIPPSPPVSLGLSPHMEASYHAHSPRSSSSHKQQHASGCGLCDSSSNVSCICQDIGLRNVQDQETSHAHEHPHRYVGRAHEEDEEMPNLDDLGLIPSSSSRIPSEMDRCGFCTESTSGACLCAEAGMRRTYKPHSRSAVIGNSAKREGEAGEHEDTLTPLPPSRIAVPRTHSSPSSSTSINLVSTGNSIPPGSTSVRLRLPKRGIAAGQIWRIDTSLATAAAQQQLQQQQQAASSVPVQSKVQEQLTHTVPVAQRNPAAAAGVALRRKLIKVGTRLPCSGDPKTCLACADDPAGQAFCSALSNTVCSTNPCANCPNRPSPLSNEVGTNTTASSSTTRHPSPYTVPTQPVDSSFPSTTSHQHQHMPSIRRRDSSARDEIPHAMIPCSDAWATLREHPNIGYANLDMLASVVAKRTQCYGDSDDKNRDQDGKIREVEREGVEEALELLDHMRDVETAKAKIDAIPTLEVPLSTKVEA